MSILRMPIWRLALPIKEFMSTELRNFLSLTYEELEELNLKAKEQRQNRTPVHKFRNRLKYLANEKRIKAITSFSATRGRSNARLRQEFLLKSWDNLTFDGSSIRGFTLSGESDLRLGSIGARSTGLPPTISAAAKSSFSGK